MPLLKRLMGDSRRSYTIDNGLADIPNSTAVAPVMQISEAVVG